MHSPAESQRLVELTELGLEQYRIHLEQSPGDRETKRKAEEMEQALDRLRRVGADPERT